MAKLVKSDAKVVVLKHIPIDSELHGKVRMCAAKENRTINYVTEEALKWWLILHEEKFCPDELLEVIKNIITQYEVNKKESLRLFKELILEFAMVIDNELDDELEDDD